MKNMWEKGKLGENIIFPFYMKLYLCHWKNIITVFMIEIIKFSYRDKEIKLE